MDSFNKTRIILTSFIKLISVVLNVSFEYLKITVNYIIWFLLFVFKFIKWYHFLCLIKALCFVSLIYCSVLVTFDYFSYPYVFKLNVNNNINGFDLPPISFCTETNVLFDKNKIISFYNSSQEFQEFRANDLKMAEKDNNKRFNKCKEDPRLLQSCKTNYESSNHYLMTNFDKNNKFIDDLSFEEKRYLMIGANHMINCSAKLHSRYDSNEYQSENCVQDLQVLHSIYGNKDFGICFTFFHSNEGFYLKDNDYIEFKLNYENGPHFSINPYFDYPGRNKLYLKFDEKSILYILFHQKNRDFVANKQNSIKLSRQGIGRRAQICEDINQFTLQTIYG